MKTKIQLEKEIVELKAENEKLAKAIANLKRNRTPVKDRISVNEFAALKINNAELIEEVSKIREESKNYQELYYKKSAQIRKFIYSTTWIDRIFYAEEHLK